MTQKPNLNIDNSSGQIVRLDIQDALKAVATHNFGQRINAGTILPCEFLADDTSNKLLIRKSSGGDQADPNSTSGTPAQFFTVGNLDEENLGLLPKLGGEMTGVLQASPGSVSAPAINFGDSQTGFYRVNQNVLGIASGGSQVCDFVRTNQDAQIQINTNTSTVNGMLDFSTDQTTIGQDFGLRIFRAAGSSGDSTIHHRSTSSSGGSLVINNQAGSNGKILFQTGGTPSSTSDVPSYTQWLIDSNGALVSNASSVPNGLTNPGATFHIEQNATTNKFHGLALVKNDIGWDTNLFLNRLNPYATGNFITFNSNNNFCGSINTSSGSTTNFNTNSSDRTLKKNFENWNENTLDLFKNLNPQKFNYLHQEDTAQKDKGFIAQEVADSFPEAYPQNDEGKYMFNPSGMVVYLMKALQESVAKIETLEAKVAALEAS
tara:strand:- start:1022 stop:2320 length:1299 start_codon:yes stop_codon:yes gene_type:complete